VMDFDGKVALDLVKKSSQPICIMHTIESDSLVLSQF
jgi:hypothetical protein